MKKGGNGKGAVAPVKEKAPKYDIGQLVIIQANLKVFQSGKRGFFGKGVNPATGQRYQIIGAVEI